ncbi:hypothetical protein [Caldovatus aquaticus]|uniref:Uncharacterized protein n=1 Tax=Caldovatus aquaticus TaxID=2865671 RepID=A0ABS7F5J0_9PROT|nr:hypothetical protein [Caldovatus aquaticus]MBW8270890.1 hypothetical protein [Caldovatus aquaticus]
MPIFLLAPREDALGDPDWEASLHVGPCLVAAADEGSARRYADCAFCRAVIERRPGQSRLPASPWSQPRLVRAEAIADPRLLGEELPEGFVKACSRTGVPVTVRAPAAPPH